MIFNTKKTFISLLIALFSLTAVFASGKKDKIFDTIEHGSYKEIKSLMRESKDYVNITHGPEKENVLMAALKEDRDIEVISLLLKYGADPLLKNKLKQNSIMYACQYTTDPEILKKIIKHNSFFDFTKKRHILRKDKDGKTAYDYAKLNESPDKILEVLNKWASEPVEREKKSAKKTKKQAKEQQNSEIPEEQQKTDSIQTDSPAETQNETISSEETEESDVSSPVLIPVVKAEPQEPPVEIEETPSATIPEPETPAPLTSEAAEIQKPAETIVLTQTTEPVPEVNPYKKTYLFDYAELENDDDLAPEDPLFDPDHIKIENPDKRDLNGRTKLMAAARNGDLKLMENLIYSDADINARDNDGWTALMFAARFTDNLKIVQSLLKNGADKSAKNNYGISALKLAAGFNKNPAIVAELISGHTAAEKDVRSSFIYAVTNGAPASILNIFLKTGIPVNAAYDGKTPLMYAAENNKDTKTIAWLLKNGARVSYRTDSGMTAFDFAKQNINLPHDQNYWDLNKSGAD